MEKIGIILNIIGSICSKHSRGGPQTIFDLNKTLIGHISRDNYQIHFRFSNPNYYTNLHKTLHDYFISQVRLDPRYSQRVYFIRCMSNVPYLTNLAALQTHAIEAFVRNCQLDVIFFDLKKVFNSMTA